MKSATLIKTLAIEAKYRKTTRDEVTKLIEDCIYVYITADGKCNTQTETVVVEYQVPFAFIEKRYTKNGEEVIGYDCKELVWLTTELYDAGYMWEYKQKHGKLFTYNVLEIVVFAKE